MTLLLLVFVAAVVAGNVALNRYTAQAGTTAEWLGTAAPEPEEILKLRFERGEIDPGEYERRLGMMRSRSSASISC